MPSLARPSVISVAVIAAPLSLIAARGMPRFWSAWDRPCATFSAVSSRYHCRWQARREWSSRTPEQQRRGPLAARRQHLARAVMEIPMPQAVDMGGLVAAHFTLLEARLGAQGALGLSRRQRAAPVQA